MVLISLRLEDSATLAWRALLIEVSWTNDGVLSISEFRPQTSFRDIHAVLK